jgi:hypothetical protein
LLFMMGGAILATCGCVTTPQEWFSRGWERYRDKERKTGIDAPRGTAAKSTPRAGEKSLDPKSKISRTPPVRSEAIAQTDPLAKRPVDNRHVAARGSEAEDVGIVRISDLEEAAPNPVRRTASRRSRSVEAVDPFLTAEREVPLPSEPPTPRKEAVVSAPPPARTEAEELKHLKSLFERDVPPALESDRLAAGSPVSEGRRAAPSTAFARPDLRTAERDAGDSRLQADALMYRARLALKRNLREDAYRLALAAERIEMERQASYGPQEERPSDFVKRLDRQRVAGLDAASNSAGIAAAPKSVGAGSAAPRSAETAAVNQFSRSAADAAMPRRATELISHVSSNQPLAVPPLVVGPSETAASRPTWSGAGLSADIAERGPARAEFGSQFEARRFEEPVEEEPAADDHAQLASANQVHPIPTSEAVNPFESPFEEEVAPPPPAELPHVIAGTNPFADPLDEKFPDSLPVEEPAAAEKPANSWPLMLGLILAVAGLCGFGAWRRLHLRHYTPKA